VNVRVRVQQTVEVDVVFDVPQGTDEAALQQRAEVIARQEVSASRTYYDYTTSVVVAGQQVTQTKVFL
jgi:hypothetical protein